MPYQYQKDPEAVLDYQWDWSRWLGEGETIDSHTVTVPDGLTLDSTSATSGIVTAWISGGADMVYRVECKIVTSAGRTDERSFYIRVREL